MRKHWTEYKYEKGWVKGKFMCMKPSPDILQGREEMSLEHVNYILWREGLDPVEEDDVPYSLTPLVYSIIVKNNWHKNGLPED